MTGPRMTYGDADAADLAFIAVYGLCLLVTWVIYLRPAGRRLPGV